MSVTRDARASVTSPANEPRWWAGAYVALAVILVVRLAALAANRTDLFFDEAQYWSWSLEPAFGYYSKPPLIAWLIAAATRVCGDGEACIRLPSPLLHTGTALAVGWLGTHLYTPKVGAIAAVAFALLPGVSFSAGLISTDVPLLACWAVALVAFAALFQTTAWWPGVVLGAALGLGLNAKYAMAWFVACAIVYLVATPARRSVVRDPRLWLGLAMGLALIVPNLMWNQAHAFATFAHTADNAKWGGVPFHPGKAIEFVIGQFGVFGPLYFAGLLVIAARGWRQRLPEADRLLLAFCLPLVAVITVQALLSRAHSNWAAVAYVSGTVVVIATLVREASWGWLRTSFGIHGALMAALVIATSTAGLVRLPVAPDPLARTLGWRAVADATRAQLADARAQGRPFAAVLTQDRSVSAELLYYMRLEPTPVRAWQNGPRPHDHFELTRRYEPRADDRVLLVTLKEPPADGPADPAGMTAAFEHHDAIAQLQVPAGARDTRRVTFAALWGIRAP